MFLFYQKFLKNFLKNFLTFKQICKNNFLAKFYQLLDKNFQKLLEIAKNF